MRAVFPRPLALSLLFIVLLKPSGGLPLQDREEDKAIIFCRNPVTEKLLPTILLSSPKFLEIRNSECRPPHGLKRSYHKKELQTKERKSASATEAQL